MRTGAGESGLRVAVAGFLHETNTFAPVRADHAAFRFGGGYVPMVRGTDMIPALRGVNLGMAGALDVARDRGWMLRRFCGQGRFRRRM